MRYTRPVIRVIGVGSPFGTDQRGWRAIEGLQEQDLGGRFPACELEMETCGVPAALASRFEGADCLVILDAMRPVQAGSPVVSVDWQHLQESNPFSGSHGFSVREALALGEAMGVLPGRVLLFGISSDERIDESSWLPVLVDFLEQELMPMKTHGEQEAYR